MILLRGIGACTVAFIFMLMVGTMAIDAWTYEQYGDCEYCVILDGYFAWRGNQ